MDNKSFVESRRTIEALRAGVPNGDAVRTLGSGQAHIIEAFDMRLDHAAALEASEPVGFVISGGFGTGKSHLLEELHQRALAGNYVSSKVAVSKETPLHAPAKMVHTAVRSMQARDIPEGLLLEMAMKIDADRPGYVDLERWCGSRQSKISIMFRTLLEMGARQGHDLNVVDLLVRYWSSESVLISEIRSALRETGLSELPTEAVRTGERPWQTIRFLARLCQFQGFRGWVIFLDEAELISRYSPISRARSYEQLSRWLGLRSEHRVPGTAVVATVINDFVPEVLDQKGDRWNVRTLLEGSRRSTDHEGIPFAEGAMRAIDNAMVLRDVDLPHLRAAHDRLRYAHSEAYQWNAPKLAVEFSPHQPMRLYVRRWINEWDLRRLYPGEDLEFEGEHIKIDFEEDEDESAEV